MADEKIRFYTVVHQVCTIATFYLGEDAPEKLGKRAFGSEDIPPDLRLRAILQFARSENLTSDSDPHFAKSLALGQKIIDGRTKKISELWSWKKMV